VAEATAPWFRYGALAGGLFLLTFGMVLASSRAKARVAPPVQVFQPAPARRATKGQPAPAPDAPLYQHAGFRELEAQRQEAARRAEVAEQNFMGVQQQLKATLTQLKELEGRLAMNETQSSTNDGELQALRDQLKDTAERLHKAELDNNALRERMTLRQQELEEAQRAASEMEGSADTAELRARLTAADERAAELVRQIEKLESELEYTNNKFHMTKLSEALREFDTDEIEIESNDDESFEHPVIIRNQGRTSPQKVR
jgi:chromosome segregation ATPase